METSNQKIPFYQKHSIILKLVFIFFLVLILLIPSSMIDDLIHERIYQSEKVKNEICQSWGPQQIIYSPILMIPIEKSRVMEDETIKYLEYLFITPENEDLSIDLPVDLRKKSIYEVPVYNANVLIKCSFNLENLSSAENETLLLDQAKIYTGLKDPTTISSKVNSTFDDIAIHFISGKNAYLGEAGAINGEIPTLENKTYHFDMNFQILGNRSLFFSTQAKNSKVKISSEWPSPGFVGNQLPSEREISDAGFHATYNFTEYKRTVPDSWTDGAYKPYTIIDRNLSGVELIQTVDHYQKTDRASKYSILIIILTFMIFFMFEIFKLNKTHPIQYVFIGFSLVLFFALLLSISEHIGFNKAYMISALSTSILVALYSVNILKDKKYSFLLFSVMMGLYLYIFILLQLENFALLAGCIGLFFILSGIMYITRKVNWYAISSREQTITTANIQY
ncbi:MAG TPA: cell envelope integrity protein CreD [Saprospiraceae bacterium]|nr:cell envelope integrity protein CreD [Saprospiraceae bacterium]